MHPPAPEPPEEDARPPAPGGTPAPRPRSGRTRTLQRVVAAVLLLAVAVVVVLERDELVRAGEVLRTADPLWLVAALVLDVASMLLYAQMQAVLLRGAEVPARFRPVAGIALAAHSLSISLPGGPLFSTAYNYRHFHALGASGAVASWVIAVSGSLSSAGLAVVGVLGGLLVGSGSGLSQLVGPLLLVVALPSAVWLLRTRPEVGRAIARGATRAAAPVVRLLARRRGRDQAAVRDRLRAAVAQLSELRVGALVWTRATTAAVVNWLLDAACLGLCCAAVGVDGLSTAELLLTYTAGMAAAHVTLVPAGLGVADATISLGLVAAGASTGSAVAATILFRIITFGAINALGWLAWWRLRGTVREAPAA